MPETKSPPRTLDVAPRILPPFDPAFRPMILAVRAYEASGRASEGIPVRLGIEREDRLVSTFGLRVHTERALDDATAFIVERTMKFLLWSRGGWRVYFDGPSGIGAGLRAAYSERGPRAFDVRLMSRIYEKPFELILVRPEEFPAGRESQTALGGHLDGCRIGFDLGASDYKVAAVRDGKVVYSVELPWSPSEQADPAYHSDYIRAGLRRAADHLPRVDAIGGSAAGVYVANQVRAASLFRSVPDAVFEEKLKPLFLKIQEEWGVPLEVINDGEVTALAGLLSLGERAVLGIAMGSSQAAGFLDSGGHIPGWLDELAFAPVDAAPGAAVDEWSGDRGVGANYFSQQAVNKLALAAGFGFDAAVSLPGRLVDLQRRLERGDERAVGIFEAIGVYLGYSIPWYERFYELANVLVLGRVMSGRSGELIMEKALEVLKAEFPETAVRVRLHLLDEKSRRFGQAVAAASLPRLPRAAHPGGRS
jgi:predicted NBD/HSP70 family sugar kinase